MEARKRLAALNAKAEDPDLWSDAARAQSVMRDRTRLDQALRGFDSLNRRYSESIEFLELAERFDVPIVDNVTIDGSVLLVIRHVIESLRREGTPSLFPPS